METSLKSSYTRKEKRYREKGKGAREGNKVIPLLEFERRLKKKNRRRKKEIMGLF